MKIINITDTIVFEGELFLKKSKHCCTFLHGSVNIEKTMGCPFIFEAIFIIFNKGFGFSITKYRYPYKARK